MAEPIKRLHYFDHQFLREADFAAEQEYHRGMRLHHNRVLHTWGVGEGLGVEFAAGASGVTVRQGMAYDGQGREIVLAEDRALELSGFPPGAAVYVTIAYDERQTDATEETGVAGNTRWTEDPLVEASQAAPTNPSQKLMLARVTRTGTDVTGLDTSERRAAGVVGGDLEVRSLTLTDPGVVSTQWPRMALGAANRADLAGSLRVAGNLTVTGTIAGNLAPNTVGPNQIADNAVTAAKILDGSVGTAELANGAVTEPKLANNAVSTRTILSGAIDEPRLANSAVSTRTIQDGGVTSAKIADNAVTAAKILDGSVGTAELANNSVPLSKIKTVTLSGTLTVGASAEMRLGIFATGHRFFVASVNPETLGSNIEWRWEAFRSTGNILNYRLAVKNLSAIVVQCEYRIYDLLEA